MLAKPDNIVAISTPYGKGGVGIVRLSGPDLSVFATEILGELPPARHARYSAFMDRQGETIDQGIALYFPAPNSYTGENVLEFQGHGGIAMPQMLLQRCLQLGARLAEPGEFTQRAFLNNKLDLAQAESIADLIDATTAQAARSAMRSLQGEFSQAVNRLVKKIIHFRMLIEATIDFPEEETEILGIDKREQELDALIVSLDEMLATARQGSLLREGVHLVLAGQPNAGKSSLLNRLSGEEVALVSEIAGTTRDIIRQTIQIEGIPVHLIDTAGLRESEDAIERMGIDRARQNIQKADMVLLLTDANDVQEEADRRILETMPAKIPVIRIYNKIDLAGRHSEMIEDQSGCSIYLSAKSGEGMQLLHDKILALVGWHHDAGAYMARERHLKALQDALSNLNSAKHVISQQEFLAEDLRLAQEKLNSITGEFTSDDLLGEIFGSFCIGK